MDSVPSEKAPHRPSKWRQGPLGWFPDAVFDFLSDCEDVSWSDGNQLLVYGKFLIPGPSPSPDQKLSLFLGQVILADDSSLRSLPSLLTHIQGELLREKLGIGWLRISSITRRRKKLEETPKASCRPQYTHAYTIGPQNCPERA